MGQGWKRRSAALEPVACAAAARPVAAGAAPGASAAANWAALLNRSAAVRASAFCSASSTPSGTASRSCRTGRGVSMNRRAIIACAVGAANGVSPASISYSTTASE